MDTHLPPIIVPPGAHARRFRRPPPRMPPPAIYYNPPLGDDSSDSDMGTLAPKTNGGNSDGQITPAEDASSDLSQIDPGMHCALKFLYSGKEDKRGRFQWQNTVPKDLGIAVENSETSKYALIVRKTKVYNDSTKVLAIHSIIVQSPLLKDVLKDVLRDYPGVTVDLKRLKFGGRFEPLIHRWSELQNAISNIDEQSEHGQETKEHAQLLHSVLWSEFETLIDGSMDMVSKGVITYEYLWTIFQPKDIIYFKEDNKDTALSLVEARYGQENDGTPMFWLTCNYVDYDGTKFGTSKLNLSITEFSGTRLITDLSAYPLKYHRQSDALRKRLIERGDKLQRLSKQNIHYATYDGVAWRLNANNRKDKYNIQGRIIIDAEGWNRFNSNYAVTTKSFSNAVTVCKSCRMMNCCHVTPYDDDIRQGSDDDPERRNLELTEEQKLIGAHITRGYSLKSRMWLHFHIDAIDEIKFNSTAFDNLVLPANQKELILGFTESQLSSKGSFDDIVEGKGKGIIILLSGPPGVGKTLTAESVAEEMRAPLYTISAGDLGLNPFTVEQRLQDILEMCTRWNAVLLLDEADVFLEERSLHDITRNELVSIFLRVLEHYQGIMVLTTNRVNTFDAAFQSRIHISIDYPELSIDSRQKVWTNFLAILKTPHTITEDQVKTLSLMNMNGRQIKNILKTAQLLACRKNMPLGFDHITMVLDVTQHLHNSNRENERTRASIFN